MADLEDFFAKKDKKKSKSKAKKFTTTDVIAKKLEDDGTKKPDKPERKERNITQIAGYDLSNKVEEVEEWAEFEEEKEKDYSGVRIKKLEIKDPEDELSDSEGNKEDGEGGGDGGPSGPWKISNQIVESQATEPEEVVQTEVPESDVSADNNSGFTKSAYVPPHMRGKESHSSAVIAPPRIGKIKGAPDINNEEYFPSLSATVNTDVPAWNRKLASEGFESVRYGNRNEAPMSYKPKLELGNKYDALQGGTS